MSVRLRCSYAVAVCAMAALLHFSANAQAAGAAGDSPYGGSDSSAASALPSSVEAEHRELHQQLARLVSAGGETGRAATEVERLLQPHFLKEERLALPPLRLLPQLAAGQLPANAGAILRLSDQLDREMPQMLAEHKKVHAALQRLQAVAEKEHKPEGVQFARALSAHAAMEEQVFYPAAQLVGKYLKSKTK